MPIGNLRDRCSLVSFVVGGVLIPQRAQLAGQLRKLERVPAEHVDVVPHERREAGEFLVADVEAVRAQLVDRGVHEPGVEQHQGVEDQTEGADLVLNAVLVALVELPLPAVEDLPGEGVAALLEVRLALDLAAVAGLVGQAQDMQGLGDP